MVVIFFAFLATLVHGHPLYVPRDGSAEDLFSTSDLNLFDDGTLAPSLTGEDHTSSSDILEPDASIFTSNLLQDYSPVNQPLTTIDESHPQNLFRDPVADSDLYSNNFDSLVASTNYGSESSPSVPSSKCESSAPGSGDFVADYDPNEDSSINMFDPSVSIANADDSMRIFNLKGRGELRYKGGGGGPYVPVARYELDPNTSPDTMRSEAYAADGTPIGPMNCPNGSKKSCCIWNAVPPFSQCWPGLAYNPHYFCSFAKNLFCCGETPEPGGPGINCQPIQWTKSRDGRKQRDPNTLQGPTSNPFQEIFPILQPLPDLTPSSDFCRPKKRA